MGKEPRRMDICIRITDSLAVKQKIAHYKSTTLHQKLIKKTEILKQPGNKKMLHTEE